MWAVSEVVYVSSYNRISLAGETYSLLLKKYTVEKHFALDFSRHVNPSTTRVLCHFGLSPALRYYAEVPVVSSLYWENTDGMRYTARVLAASKDGEAKRLLEQRGITHLAVWLVDYDIFTYDALHNGRGMPSPAKSDREYFWAGLSRNVPCPFF